MEAQKQVLRIVYMHGIWHDFNPGYPVGEREKTMTLLFLDT